MGRRISRDCASSCGSMCCGLGFTVIFFSLEYVFFETGTHASANSIEKYSHCEWFEKYNTEKASICKINYDNEDCEDCHDLYKEYEENLDYDRSLLRFHIVFASSTVVLGFILLCWSMKNKQEFCAVSPE